MHEDYAIEAFGLQDDIALIVPSYGPSPLELLLAGIDAASKHLQYPPTGLSLWNHARRSIPGHRQRLAVPSYGPLSGTI